MKNLRKTINNKEGKNLAIWMVIYCLILEIILVSVILKFWIVVLILNFYFLFFVYKQLNYNEYNLEIYFPLRPFFRRRIVNMDRIKHVSFMAYGKNGPNSDPFIRFVLTKSPFFVEFRIKEPEEVLEFFRTVAENNTFSVKSRMKQNHYVLNDLMKQGIKSNLNFKGE